MRRGLPDRRRHPQRLAARLHPVRPLHRRVRRGHDQDRSPDPADQLRHRREHQAPRARRAAGLSPRASRTILYAALMVVVGALMLFQLTTATTWASACCMCARRCTRRPRTTACATATRCAFPTSGASRAIRDRGRGTEGRFDQERGGRRAARRAARRQRRSRCDAGGAALRHRPPRRARRVEPADLVKATDLTSGESVSVNDHFFGTLRRCGFRYEDDPDQRGLLRTVGRQYLSALSTRCEFVQASIKSRDVR